MRVAHVVPLHITIPSQQPGPGSIIAALIDELISQGHEVTLFATADADTNANLVPLCEQLVEYAWPDWIISQVLLIEQVYKQAEAFDIIHSHIECLAAPLARRSTTPTLSTLHVPMEEWHKPLLEEYREMPYAAVSAFQRSSFPHYVNWKRDIAYGLPANRYIFQPTLGKYLAYIDRPDSSQDSAMMMTLTRRVGIKLKVARCQDDPSALNGNSAFASLSENPMVEYLGVLNEDQMAELISHAFALVIPSTTSNPFEMRAIESLAYGTPVIVKEEKCLPELIEAGRNGFTFQTLDDAVIAITDVSSIDRQETRACFEERFTAKRMAADYAELYEQILHQQGVDSQRKSVSMPSNGA